EQLSAITQPLPCDPERMDSLHSRIRFCSVEGVPPVAQRFPRALPKLCETFCLVRAIFKQRLHSVDEAHEFMPAQFRASRFHGGHTFFFEPKQHALPGLAGGSRCGFDAPAHKFEVYIQIAAKTKSAPYFAQCAEQFLTTRGFGYWEKELQHLLQAPTRNPEIMNDCDVVIDKSFRIEGNEA